MSILEGEYEWTGDLVRLFKESTISKSISVLLNISLRPHPRNIYGFHASDTIIPDGESYGGEGCCALRKVTFTNCLDQENYKYISIYLYYYTDKKYTCTISHNGDYVDESFLDQSIGGTLFSRIKSAYIPS